jgi:predicted RNase H-like nuclease
VVVTTGSAGGSPGSVEVVRFLDDVVDRVRAGELVAVGLDMPIGLAADGVRPADRAARALLGARRSSLFPTPPASVLDATDYADALHRCRAATGKGLSVQAFNLVPKMREVAGCVTPALQPAICEVHPETSLAVMRGAPCSHPKRTAEGAAERLAALRTHFANVDEALASRPRGAQVDDVIDAFAAAWTARRIALGDALVLGDPGARDPRGFRLTITA